MKKTEQDGHVLPALRFGPERVVCTVGFEERVELFNHARRQSPQHMDPLGERGGRQVPVSQLPAMKL